MNPSQPGRLVIAGGSGFLAVYVAGIVLASRPMPYRAGIRRVHDAHAWLSQLGMFLLLGLLVFPSRLLPSAAEGLGIGLVLACVARPAAVLLTLSPFRATWRERSFIAWVGLRGAVPIVLAAYPVLRGVPDAERIFHLVFFVVLVNSLVPGASVAWLARRWGLVEAARPTPPAQVELVSLCDYAPERLEAACKRANAAGIRSYKGVHNILQNKLDQRQLDPASNTPLPPHENIRGENYYR